MTSEFRTDSLEIIRHITLKERRRGGIFFTPKKIRTALIQRIVETGLNVRTVLEPSMGSGEFIRDISSEYPGVDITGIEINRTIYDKQSHALPATRTHCCDFLEFKASYSFDLIIGNPPYFQIKPADKGKYKSIYPELGGKFDIYIIFILKSLRLLSPNTGILAFVLPKTFINTQSYENVRRLISGGGEYTIIDVMDFKEHDSTWCGTKQSTIGLIVQRRQSSALCRFVFEAGPLLSVVNSSDTVDALHTLTHGYHTLCELGYTVKTGEIIWTSAEYRPLMTDEGELPSTKLLIHNSQIHDNTYVPKKPRGSSRPLYIQTCDKFVITDPFIAVNRGNGNGGNLRFQCALIEPAEYAYPLVAENHIYKISGPSIRELYASLCDPRTLEFIQHTVGNGILTKTLIGYIPFFYK